MSCKPNRRVPQCARCRSHNIFSNVRGHKRVCQWKDCTCAKCQMVTEKRRITAVRVAVLRRERKRRMSSRRMSFNNFQLGAATGAWGMMGSMSENYAAEQFMENRRMIVQNDAFRSDMFHGMAYPPLYSYDNEYLYPGHGLPHGEEPEAKEPPHGDINNNIESFEHEYVSLMRRQDDEEIKDMLPGNQNPKQIENHSISKSCPNAAQRIFAPQTSAPFYINGPTVSQEPPRFVSMMLNAPLTLPCSYPIRKSRGIPFRVGF